MSIWIRIKKIKNPKTYKPSRDGQATRKKITVLGDRARAVLKDVKRQFYREIGRIPTLNRSLKTCRSKQPFAVRLYMTLVRTEFDSARVHSINHFRTGPLIYLAKTLFGDGSDVILSKAKKLIKEYSQIRWYLSMGDSAAINSLNPGLVAAFRTIVPPRVSDLRKRRKFRKVALEMFQFKRVLILDEGKENDTKLESIDKYVEVVSKEGPKVDGPQRDLFRRKARQLLREQGFRYVMEDGTGVIPSRSSTYDFPAGEFPLGGSLTSYQNHTAQEPLAPVITTPKGIWAPGTTTSLFRDLLLDSRAKEARIVSVSDTFKDRVLTIHPGHQHLLTGLQQSLLTWLGSLEAFFVTKDTTDGFITDVMQTGTLFCSGDYSQATDTFCSDLTEIILEEVVECIDFHMDLSDEELDIFKRYIIESCTRWQLIHPNGDRFLQRRGQLMGTVLSFPVLNMYNYCAYSSIREEFLGEERSSSGHMACVRINGDDILFNAFKEFIYFWRKKVASYGMTLNAAKTSVSDKYCSLNSQYYRYDASEGFVRFRHQGMVLINSESGWDPREKRYRRGRPIQVARALFQLEAYRGLNYWFKLNGIPHIEMRRFFGPITEEESMRRDRNINMNLMSNAIVMTGQKLVLESHPDDSSSSMQDEPVFIDSHLCIDYHRRDILGQLRRASDYCEVLDPVVVREVNIAGMHNYQGVEGCIEFLLGNLLKAFQN